MRPLVLLALVVWLPFSAAHAAETITYTYDARGRVVNVVHSGSVNNGVATAYIYDKADNRKRMVVSGSPSPPP